MSTLQALAELIQHSKGIVHKKDIAAGMNALGSHHPSPTAVQVGDDCAVLPAGEGFLLFAIEGFMNEFVQADPWFAGYCAVMVNVSDIAAMGGRATAVVDAVWCPDHDQLALILKGMAEASAKYQVPIVGGHTNARTDRNQLAASILGEARSVLSSFTAKPGDVLMSVIDLRGEFYGAGNNWNASTNAPAERLRADLALLPQLAEGEFAHACKDISMAGPLGTTLMMLECSGCGAEINPDAFPRPEGVALERWMQVFPSYGFVFSVAPQRVDDMAALFESRGLRCASVGQVQQGSEVWLTQANERARLWDFSGSPLLGCTPLNHANRLTGEAHAYRAV